MINSLKYRIPSRWIHYDKSAILQELAEAKGAIIALKTLPFQRRWVEALQAMQLKLEVAGTSKIEGADFTGGELEAAMKETPEQLFTRSQKQAHAAMQTYKWITTIPDDHPITKELVCEIHRKIVTGGDDDRCEPGKTRPKDRNVIFGAPLHRGCEGGDECSRAFERLMEAVQKGFSQHDPLIQALALHYHFAAMHPFEDGNGRTARALEALLLQRAGMRDSTFIAMSNFYYDEKTAYLTSLNEVWENDYDLTPFLKFGLRGIAFQSERLAREIRKNVSREVFRSLIYDLFGRLQTKRKRIIAERQRAILLHLLGIDEVDWPTLYNDVIKLYTNVKNPDKAVIRDMNHLIALGAIGWRKEEKEKDKEGKLFLRARLEWPTEITETEFFKRASMLPRAKEHVFVGRR
ncbi:MAG TPA: Fic family protein [Terriglobales bacterium]|jgi:Fic family protein|nr:Fic family protein [Terriglobales bacterium]